jgi:hypothetical protein
MGATGSGALAVGNRVVLVVVGAAFIFVGASWGRKLGMLILSLCRRQLGRANPR